jgi:uncharacterized membrane protein
MWRRPLPLALFYLLAGTMHFVKPRAYAAIVPDALPRKREIVYASGVAELAGAAGVLYPRTRRLAGWWLIATLVAVFPANVNMAVNAGRFKGIPPWALWVRLPIQALLIAWAYRAAATKRSERFVAARRNKSAWHFCSGPGRR